MKKQFFVILSYTLIVCFLLILPNVAVSAGEVEQQPTVDIPTVTGTPSGSMVIIPQDQEQVNVRSGPGTDYEIVGVLVAGEQVPALGKTVGGGWIQVEYIGTEQGVAWVYATLVQLSVGSELGIVEPPSVPTPRVSPTIDPTLAAEFVFDQEPTRLPTYTEPAPLIVPTFSDFQRPGTGAQLPMGIIIVVLASIGVLGALISFLRGR